MASAFLYIASGTNSLYELLYNSDKPMSQLGTEPLVRGVPTWFPAVAVGVADRDATSRCSLGLSLCTCIWGSCGTYPRTVRTASWALRSSRSPIRFLAACQYRARSGEPAWHFSPTEKSRCQTASGSLEYLYCIGQGSDQSEGHCVANPAFSVTLHNWHVPTGISCQGLF